MGRVLFVVQGERERHPCSDARCRVESNSPDATVGDRAVGSAAAIFSMSAATFTHQRAEVKWG
jgi:hypothetical protein